MLAAVALVLSSVILIQMKHTKYIWVTLVPAIWLLICTTWALGLKLFSSDPQLEGFIYLAHSYQDKIATATAVTTAQKLSDMHHIVINNYTNAGIKYFILTSGVQHYILWA